MEPMRPTDPGRLAGRGRRGAARVPKRGGGLRPSLRAQPAAPGAPSAASTSVPWSARMSRLVATQGPAAAGLAVGTVGSGQRGRRMAGPRDLNEDFVRSLPDEGPVVMVNLVRFRERSLDGQGSGWDAYSRYSKDDMPLF